MTALMNKHYGRHHRIAEKEKDQTVILVVLFA